jgi:GDP-L-fucose synthase
VSNIYVAGHGGLVGSAICRRLVANGVEPMVASRSMLDLVDQGAVNSWFTKHQIDQVYLAAAKVGGIHANEKYPAEFIRENLAIQSNVIHAAWKHGVEKILFLGSSCIYPKLAQQPIDESSLLTGALEPTNEWYAIAKIAGVKMCQAYRKQYGFNAIAVMPTNLYGPGDNFDLENSHVLPAMIRRFHEAKEKNSESVVIWGTGEPRREFLHVDDLADACIYLMTHYNDAEIVNVGCGDDIRIADLAEIVKEIVGFPGTIRYDTTRPDGTPRKLLDVGRMSSLGWKARIPLRAGIAETYQWFLANLGALRIA